MIAEAGVWLDCDGAERIKHTRVTSLSPRVRRRHTRGGAEAVQDDPGSSGARAVRTVETRG